MDVVLSALSFVFAAPEMAADMAIAVKQAPPTPTYWSGWSLILGGFGFAALASIAAIMVMGFIGMLSKKEKLIQPGEDVPPLARGEMSFFERLAEQRPLAGRVGAVVFMVGLAVFYVLTLGSMTNEETFADKLKKEGQEKARIERQRQQEAKEAMSSAALAGPDDGEKMKAGGLLEAMDDEMKAD